jgi:integrase
MRAPVIFKEMLDGYLAYREVSGLKKSTTFSLVQFYRDCNKRYPESAYLTQEMIDWWCAKRDTEKPASRGYRTNPVITFLKHALQRKWIDLEIPVIPHVKRDVRIPYAFSENELKNFFKACDEIKDGAHIQVKLRKMEVPVFFRLLYSSGLRTTEARLLRKEDVNLQTGVIHVRYTKGYNEHRIVLHDSMRELLVRYDRALSKLMPDRKIFFPSYKDKCHCNIWVYQHFNGLWYKYNDSKTVAYCLRHNYAVENINKWTNHGFEVHDKLVALSKSMGHSTLKSTMYYYSLVPKLAGIIENLSGESYNEIIPDLPDYDTQE